MSPSDSTSAFLHSIIPPPVRSRSSLTWAALISAIGLLLVGGRLLGGRRVLGCLGGGLRGRLGSGLGRRLRGGLLGGRRAGLLGHHLRGLGERLVGAGGLGRALRL